MKVLVISDVHGNLPSLEFVLREEKDADLIISLGDVVNYGPWSNECVLLLDSLSNKVLLKGNHEDAFLSGIYPGEHPVASSFFSFCYPSFTQQEKIARYIIDYTMEDFYLVHTLNDSYIFEDSEVEISRNTFIGHSHAPFIKESNGFRLVNAGSVGQNRKNIDELNYVRWWPMEHKLELVRKEFNADLLINEMKAKRYPEICMNYILSKRKVLS